MVKNEEKKVVNEVIDLEDNASYNLKSAFVKGEVAREHVTKCLISRSVEMKASYFNSSISNSGEEVKTYIPDSRKAFISSIKALKILLYPEILEEEGVKSEIGKIEEKEKYLFNKFCYEEKILSDNKLIITGNKFIPETDASLIVKTIDRDGVLNNDYLKGAWNDKISLYWEKMIDIYDDLFSTLIKLIHKKDYFNPERVEF